MKSMRTLTIAAVAAVGLALAGCGGGDGGTADAPVVTDPAPTPVAVALPGNIPTGMAPSGTHTIAAGASATSNGVTFSCPAGGEACTVTVAANGSSATSTGGTATAALSQAAQTAIENANKVSEADKKAMQAAAKDALALFNSFSDTIDDGTTADVVTATVTAVRDNDDGGGSAKITATVAPTTGTGADAVGPNLGGNDVVRTAAPMLGAWQGTMLTDADTARNSSTAVVYTDVEPNESKTWALAGYGSVDSQTVTALLALPATRGVIAAVKFSTSGLKDHHGERNTTSNVISIDGTFDGAQGVYTCTSAAALACTSNLTTGGIVLGGSGAGWSFNPADNATVSQPDADYAYFGWWLNKTAGGNPEVDIFRGYTGSGAVTQTTFNALGGTATYKGAAAGKYAMNRGADQYASGGHWTADATLIANFEDPTGTDAAARVSAAGSISGTIDGFMAGGESMDWSVKLNSSDITIAADAADWTGATTVWTIGGAKAAAGGSWEGEFHNQTAPPRGNDVPTTVTGEFSATYGTVGHMVGAFGAHVDE